MSPLPRCPSRKPRKFFASLANCGVRARESFTSRTGWTNCDRVGDRVTIFRDGESVHTCPLSEFSTAQLIKHMVGREVTSIYSREPLPAGPELAACRGLTRKGVLHDISFALRAGEIVGLAGLVGAGRTELCRALFGVDRIDSGRVYRGGQTGGSA